MTWKKVIIFSLIAGAVTAIVAMIPALVNTSFHDIAVYLDAWILFSLIIIMNCKDEKEAMLKCFVFFLISQPLIYLIQAIFTSEGFAIFRYYPRWLIFTFLTLPGTFIAYKIKKQDLLSVFILSVANCFLAYEIAYYISNMKISFPNHLLSTIFCAASIALYIYALLEKKNHRIIAIILVLLTLLISCLLLGVFKGHGTKEIELGDGEWSYRFDGKEIVDVDIKEDKAILKTKENGNTTLFFDDAKNDNELEYAVTVSGNDIFVSLMKNKKEEELEKEEAKKKEEEAKKKEVVEVREEKIMYTYQEVETWDEEHFLEEVPEGIYNEKIQYGTSIASFDNNNFVLGIPADGFYREIIQYGYNQRDKKQVTKPYTESRQSHYNNNQGGCPSDCISSTINAYGDGGCDCTIIENYTVNRTGYEYGTWTLKNDSWRANTPYEESDVVQPITRTVYLVPTSWADPTDWSYENKNSTKEAKVVERKVYVKPATFTAESAYQDQVPSGNHIKINSYNFYRIVTNGVPGEWIKVENKQN